MVSRPDAEPVYILGAEARVSRASGHGPAPGWRGDNVAAPLPLLRRLGHAPGGAAPDPALLSGLAPETCIGLGFVPWRRVGRTTLLAWDGRVPRERILAALPEARGRVAFAPASRREVEAAIAEVFADGLARRARTRTPAALSCRTPLPPLARGALATAAAGAALAALLAPAALLGVLLLWITVVTFATMAVRATALIESLRRAPAAPAPSAGVIPFARDRALPVVSLLIPLRHEDLTLRHLVDALARLEYPKDRLDVKLVLEADDHATALAIAEIDPPDWIETLRAPPDTLRTKPRALNVALDFCRGTVVGIYDAEDRPEPGQLRAVVRHLQAAPPAVACVQGHLDFYNARQNWLARCFALEYAIWFRVLLHGVQRLGMPVPLGGTSVFFRREALVSAGAWDAHNVTEDADLGMRLARLGYRTEMVATTTMEEANCRAGPWIRQRARWLKGYAMTWATHMRTPGRLWRELGPMGFAGFQIILLGGLTSYLATPLFWALWGASLGLGLPLWQLAPPAVWTGFFATMAIGQALMLAVAARAVWAPERRHLLRTVPTLVFYWPLGAVAAYRAIWEAFRTPFHWHKTRHGL